MVLLLRQAHHAGFHLTHLCSPQYCRPDIEVGSEPRVRRVPICYLSLTQTGLDLFGFAIVVWRERT